MKKSLLALAALGMFAGAASAQSSVTVFGIVDLSVNSVKNGDNTVKSMNSNQLNSNRIGFRGVEDLGGGLKAAFHLEGAMNSDEGTGAATGGGLNFQRRSTLSLIGNFGEVRLGRDYTNTFWLLASAADAYGANGMGNGSNVYLSSKAYAGSGAGTGARANNMVGYFLPGGLGGLYGNVQVAAGEGTNTNKYVGARVGYAAGPLDISAAFSKTEVTSANDFKVTNIGGSYDFGVVKVYGLWDQRKYAALKYTTYELSASVPLGQGEFRAAYTKGDAEGGSTGGDDATLFGLEYIYNLSKRTALYAQYGRATNDGTSAVTVGIGTGVAGKNSTGYGAGIRHSF